MSSTNQTLSGEQLEAALTTLDVEWSAIPGEGLVRVIKTAHFAEGLALLNKIAHVAEERNHHPDLALSYSQLKVTLITHSASGVTQTDVDMAASIDSLLTDS